MAYQPSSIRAPLRLYLSREFDKIGSKVTP